MDRLLRRDGPAARLHVDPAPWFAIGDDESIPYADKLVEYQKLADEHFDTDRYREFCEASLPDIDEQMLDWVTSPDFDRMLLQTIRSTYPDTEHDRFTAHFRGLIDLWINDEAQRPRR